MQTMKRVSSEYQIRIFPMFYSRDLTKKQTSSFVEKIRIQIGQAYVELASRFPSLSVFRKLTVHCLVIFLFTIVELNFVFETFDIYVKLRNFMFCCQATDARVHRFALSHFKHNFSFWISK